MGKNVVFSEVMRVRPDLLTPILGCLNELDKFWAGWETKPISAWINLLEQRQESDLRHGSSPGRENAQWLAPLSISSEAFGEASL
jgi:hypothetical protein